MGSLPTVENSTRGILAETTPLVLTESLKQPRSQARRATFQIAVTLCEILLDFVAVVSAVAFADFLYRGLHLGKDIHYPIRTVLELAAAFAALIIFMLDYDGAYRRDSSLLRVKETERVLRVMFRTALLAFSVSFLTSLLFSRWLLTLSLLCVGLFLISEKQLLYVIVRNLHSRGLGVQRVLIYGAGQTGKRIFSMLARSPKLGLDPIALVDDDPSSTGSTVFEMSYQRKKSAPVLRGPLTRDLIVANEVAHVIIAIPSLPSYRFQETVQEITQTSATVAFVPTQSVRSDLLVHYEDLDGQLVASFWENARTGYELLKAVWDVVATLVILALTTPLFIVLAVLIKLDSAGSVFFLQRRIGLNGKPFRLWKFRTMLQETDPYDFSPKEGTDPRITRVGRFLRRTSLDELPQLFNVLMGDMALVGPRPEMPFIVEQYTSVHRQRLRVKPGLTGLWQLSADRAYLIHENIQYDLYYIRNRNFFLDLAILLHTVVFAMRGV